MKIIDITKLEKVVSKEDKKVARCPACAKSGGDSKGVHLVIYPDGRFGCAAHPDEKEHRKQILALVGVEADYSSWPRPVEIIRPACADRDPKRLYTLSLTTKSSRVSSAFESDEEWAEFHRESALDPSQQPLPKHADGPVSSQLE